MVACCIPRIVSTPALRSSALNSFISRLLFRVHAADSNEHHAVLSVASAISKAATGSTHFFFSAGSCIGPGESSCGFTRSGLAFFVRAVRNAFAYDDKEKCGGETEHQNSCEALDRAKHTPFFRQHEIAVPDSGVGDRRKIERRLEIGQTF